MIPNFRYQFYALKSVLIGFLVLAGVLIPLFFVSAIEYTSILLNFYADSGNSDRITFKWVYNIDYLPEIDKIIGGAYYRAYQEEVIEWSWLEFIPVNCTSNEESPICYLIPKKLIRTIGTTPVVMAYNETGLTYNEVSEWLGSWHCLEIFYSMVYWKAGGSGSADWPIAPFCWGDPEIPYYEPPSGIEPIITAEKPIECAWNQEEDWLFDLKGKIEIPLENPNIYTKFLLRLYVRQPMEMGLNFVDILFTEFPNLKAGEIWNWDFPEFEIPENENGYFLTYWLEGYNAETLKPFRWALMPIDICGKDTILSDKTEFPVGLIPVEWIEMIYEDCSLLTGFEKIMCEFTNWVKSIFAPSKEQLDALNQDIDQIKTKFPFTYISVFFDFIKNVKNGIVENKEISFKILGVEGAVNLDFWGETTSYGGVLQSFQSFFKGFLTLIVLVGFIGGWLIPFIRKIL